MDDARLAAKQDEQVFDRAADALQGLLGDVGAVAAWDGELRKLYQDGIRAEVDRLRAQAKLGRLSWKAAANEACELRNGLMDTLRARSSPVGRAVAQWMKLEGLNLNQLIARYTLKLFGPQARFTALSALQQRQVYAEIVEAAARSRPLANALGAVARHGGRALFIASVAYSVYEVATSDQPGYTAMKEGSILGAGLAGSVGGGALAGLACGPGAPVCVAVGAFVGGAVFAFGVSMAWK